MPRLYWRQSKGRCPRYGYPVEMIVLHYTWGSEAGDLKTLLSARASSHLYITLKGHIYWLVRFEETAYHAGINGLLAPIRKKRIRPNERSIGIEIEGFGKYTEAQYRALEFVLPVIMKRFKIPLNFLPDPWYGMDPSEPARYPIEDLEHFKGILGHGNIHKSKVDPGLNFDWDRMKCLDHRG